MATAEPFWMSGSASQPRSHTHLEFSAWGSKGSQVGIVVSDEGRVGLLCRIRGFGFYSNSIRVGSPVKD